MLELAGKHMAAGQGEIPIDMVYTINRAVLFALEYP